MIEQEKLKFYLSKATEEKDAIKPIYNKILELTDPFSIIKDEGKLEINSSNRTVDSDILDAISSLVSFIMSSILPRTGRWADLAVDEGKMKEMFGDRAQQNIDQINSVLKDDIDTTFRYIQNSNYYEEIVKAMKSYVRVGTGCYAIRETGIPSKPFVYQYVGLDNLFILNDNFSNPNIVFKKHPDINGDYLKDVFGKDIEMPNGVDEENLNSNITVYECVIPDYDEESTLTTYNYMVLTEDLTEILLEKQLEYNPFVVFRWDTIEGSSWGSSAVIEQIGLLEELQEYQDLYKAQAKRIANPPGIFYGNVELFNSLSMEDGTLNYGGDPKLENNGSGFYSNLQTIGNNGSLMPLDKLIQDCRDRFKSALMVKHLTMSIEDVKYGTATAVAIMNDLFRKRFSNTYEMINNELVNPTFLSPFIILLKYNQLSLTTEVLPYTNVIYVSELSKANNMSDINKVMQYTQYVAQLKQAQSFGIALNLPKSIAYISNKLEIPPDLVPTESELQDIQEYEQQVRQMQMQQQAIATQEGEVNAENEQ